ncbi:MAG: MerR family transcriptional regulator [Myxococcota bacterium]
MDPPLADRELDQIERDHKEGLTSHQIVELFAGRGARFSEATLRKYVQLGLLPRSRRVGLKGKHRGSQGLYPATAIRRICVIKRMMGESHTIEEVREILAHSFEVDALRQDLDAVLAGLESRLGKLAVPSERRRSLDRELDQARHSAGELVRRIEELEKQSRPALRRPSVAVPPAPPRTGDASR